MNKNNCTKTLSGYHAWNTYAEGVDHKRTMEYMTEARKAGYGLFRTVPKWIIRCDGCGMINDLETKTPNLSVEP